MITSSFLPSELIKGGKLDFSMLLQHFESYPVRRHIRNPNQDNFGRLLPPLPKGRIPTPQYQYRQNTFLRFQPYTNPPNVGDSILIEITKTCAIGFGRFNQIFSCKAMIGTESALQQEMVAVVYGPLYIDTFDLPQIIRDGIILA